MNWGNKVSADGEYGVIIRDLFTYYCNLNVSHNRDVKYHQYLYQTFGSLVQFKNDITINIDFLSFYVKDELLLGLLINRIIKLKNKSNITAWIDDIENEDRRNLVNPILFKVFSNVRQISIIASGWGYYPFSLLSLLSIVENTSINKVKIRLDEETYDSLRLSSKLREIKKQYKQNEIKLKITDS